MAEENSGFQALIESVNKSNTSLANVEEHTRNSRRHLLEMKKSVFQMAEITEQLASPDTESRREDVARQERMIDALEAVKGNTGKSAGGGGGAQKGGFLGALGGGGIGGFLGGAGLGVGAAAGGLGLLAGGGALLLKELSEFDGEAVKKNVLALTEIADELVAKEGSVAAAFGKTGLLTVMLSGLGVGLAAFGVGAGINTVVAKFEDPNNPFSKTVKKNVETLMSIADLEYTATDFAKVSGGLAALGLALIAFGAGSATATAGAALDKTVEKFMDGTSFADTTVQNVRTLLSLADIKVGDAAGVALALGSLGVGLALFGAGQTVKSVGDLASAGASAAGKAAGVTMFTEGTSFGERVKTDVSALLDIMSHKNATFGKVAAFPLVMGSIGAGLIAFAIGETATAASGAAAAGTAKLSDGVKLFTEGKSNAQRVKDEVEIYLSIADKPFDQLAANVGKFAGVMGGISAGLAVFAIGEGATAISGFLGNMSAGEDGSQAERVKKQVDLLLSIGEGKDLENAKKAGTAMKDLGIGLGSFAKSEFIGSIASVGTAIAGFFAEGPFDKVLELSKDADNLEKAARAVGLVADNLGKISGITIAEGAMDIKTFAEDLKESVPIIEAAIMGQKGGFALNPFGADEIKGLANNAASFDQAKRNLETLRGALDPGGAGGAATDASEVAITAGSVLVTGPITATGPISAQGSVGGGNNGNAGAAGENDSTRKKVIDAAETVQ